MVRCRCGQTLFVCLVGFYVNGNEFIKRNRRELRFL